MLKAHTPLEPVCPSSGGSYGGVGEAHTFFSDVSIPCWNLALLCFEVLRFLSNSGAKTKYTLRQQVRTD